MLGKKEVELSVLKNFADFYESQKHSIINFAREQVKLKLFSINRICNLCRISENTFYNHRHLDDNFSSKYRHLRKSIEKIIELDCSYGVKRIKVALWQEYETVLLHSWYSDRESQTEMFFGRLKEEWEDEFNELENFKEIEIFINKRKNTHEH